MEREEENSDCSILSDEMDENPETGTAMDVEKSDSKVTPRNGLTKSLSNGFTKALPNGFKTLPNGLTKPLHNEPEPTTSQVDISLEELDLEDENPSEEMRIVIKTQAGSEISMNVQPDYTTEVVKAAIHRQQGVLPDQQRLIFQGQQLEDGRKLSSYRIQNQSILHLVLRLQGGM